MSRTSRINAAANDCLARCYGRDKPIPVLVQFLIELRLDGTWTDNDIEEVEFTVLHLLKASEQAA